MRAQTVIVYDVPGVIKMQRQLKELRAERRMLKKKVAVLAVDKWIAESRLEEAEAVLRRVVRRKPVGNRRRARS